MEMTGKKSWKEPFAGKGFFAGKNPWKRQGEPGGGIGKNTSGGLGRRKELVEERNEPRAGKNFWK